jgi:esterase/lipase
MVKCIEKGGLSIGALLSCGLAQATQRHKLASTCAESEDNSTLKAKCPSICNVTHVSKSVGKVTERGRELTIILLLSYPN